MKVSSRIFRLIALVLVSGLLGVPAAASARDAGPVEDTAGRLSPVTNFGSNPGNLLMFEVVPAGLPADAPVVVVLHGCFASASLYDDETGWPMLAERWKVALVFPEQTVVNDPTKCFRFWNPDHNARGKGEALSVKQMVDWMHANRQTDPGRTFVMGHSGGGLFTSVMLAAYPDVFSAGAIVAGGPYGCGDEGAVKVGIDGQQSPIRGGECIDGSVDKSATEWGDLARAAHPGYDGRMPRVSIWHGTRDTTVTFKNLYELVEQWTDVHGIDQVADAADTVKDYPHKIYADQRGRALVETYELTDQSHGWPYAPGTAEDECDGRAPSWNAGICAAYHAGIWFGLDQTKCPRPGRGPDTPRCAPPRNP